MMKFMIAFAPPDGMSRQACIHHYRHRHGALVGSVPEFRAEVMAYCQNEVLQDGSVSGPRNDIAGVSELWFSDWARYGAAFSHPRYLERIRPDEARFADLSSVLVAFATEQVVFKKCATPVYKLFLYREKSIGLAHGECTRLWDAYGRAAAADPRVAGLADAYIRNNSVPPHENPFPLARVFDCIDEFWLRRPEDAESIASLLVEHASVAGLGTDSVSLRFVAQVFPVPGFGGAKLRGDSAGE
ncbi:EthD domain-containing protein [Sphingosinicella sp. LHD-64]|uniref:EthD domain-containing protein n=1 Tax=Sphingosinicella sp. LHD-64 TaxID=3072139 RepID=UPI0028105DD3|nr:EthD domain-containing protein [Sphingosinicella sp. LHD-64]MDQ8757437.1 EthD domain-containing protein [Sphingosinicella sp. LHD-64]